jgi:hypothetical protein
MGSKESFYYTEESDSGIGYDLYFTQVTTIDTGDKVTNFLTHIGKINNKLHADIIVRLLNDYMEEQKGANEDEDEEQVSDVIDGVSVDDWINRLSTIK